MKKSIILTLLFIILLAFTACEDIQEPLEVGTEAPDFTLQSSSGAEVKLSDFSSKVLLMFFFGNGWPSCRAVAPDIESELVTPYADRSDYAVLGLDQWDGNVASVESFKRATGVSFPLLLDASNVAAKYKTTYDRLIVIDKLRDIVFSGTRGASADIEKVKEKIDALLTE